MNRTPKTTTVCAVWPCWKSASAMTTLALALLLIAWCGIGIAQGPPPPDRAMGDRLGPPPDHANFDRPGPPPDGPRFDRPGPPPDGPMGDRPGPPPEPDPDLCAQNAKTKLGLSDAQTQQFVEMMKTKVQKMRVLREKEEAFRREQQQAVQDMHQEFQGELDTLLTDEQKQALEQLPPPERGRLLGIGPRDGRGPGRGPDGMGPRGDRPGPGGMGPRGDRPGPDGMGPHGGRPPRRGEGAWGPAPGDMPPPPPPAAECTAQ